MIRENRMMNHLKFIPFVMIIAGCSTTPDPVYIESKSSNISASFMAGSQRFGYEQDTKDYMKELFKHVFSMEHYTLWLYEKPELCNDSKKVDVKNLDAKKLMIPTSSYATMKIVKKFPNPGTTMQCENIFSFKVNEKSNYLINHVFSRSGCTVTIFDDTTNEKLKLFERKKCSIDELEASKLTDTSKAGLSFPPIVWY